MPSGSSTTATPNASSTSSCAAPARPKQASISPPRPSPESGSDAPASGDLAEGSAGPWLFTIARRVLIASVQKRRLESEARRRLGLLVERPNAPEPDAAWIEGLEEALTAPPLASAPASSCAWSTSSPTVSWPRLLAPLRQRRARGSRAGSRPCAARWKEMPDEQYRASTRAARR